MKILNVLLENILRKYKLDVRFSFNGFKIIFVLFRDCKEAPIHKFGLDDETAKWLWEQSEKLTKISTKME